MPEKQQYPPNPLAPPNPHTDTVFWKCQNCGFDQHGIVANSNYCANCGSRKNHIRDIEQLEKELEVYKSLAESRGIGLVNIWKIATCRPFETIDVRFALGLATSEVDKLVRELSKLRPLVNHKYIPSEGTMGILYDNPCKVCGKDSRNRIHQPPLKPSTAYVSKPSPLCIPFSLDPLPTVPQAGSFVSQKVPQDNRKCSVEDCYEYGQFRFCGIWICYCHQQKLEIVWRNKE